MRDKRSYLDSVNAGRRRRAGASLDEIDLALDRLEESLGHDRRGRRPAASGLRREAPRDRVRDERDHRRAGLSDEMQVLREELRQQMSTGLRHEFDTLKNEIERGLRVAATGGAPDGLPGGQVAELNAELERLSSMVQRISGRNEDRHIQHLRLEMEDMKKALSQLAREETLRSFDRRWGEFDRRFSDMAGSLAGSLAGSSADADPAFKTLAARIEEIGGAVSALPTSGALRSLEDKMRVLHNAVERVSHQPRNPDAAMFDAIGERLDEISRAVAAASAAPRAAAFDPEPFERIEARISSLARQLGETAQDNGAVRDLGDQLAALSHRVEDLAHRVDLPERSIERLAGQIGTIADRLDRAPALPNLDAVFHGLENRLASMSTLLEQRHEDALAQGRALFHDLESRMEEVAARIEAERVAPETVPGNDEQFIAAMDARFAELAARFERQAAVPQADGGAIRDLEKRLDTISSRIESSAAAPAVDPALIRSLESQIAGLADHIARPAAGQDGSDIGPRLDQIEQSIAASKNDILEAARRAAEDAARKFSGTPAESALVAGLADDLKSLETLTRKSDDRNARTFEAIHDTLLKIVDRLGALETAGPGTAVAAAAMPAAAIPVAEAARDMALGPARTPSLAPEDAGLPLPAIAATVEPARKEEAVAGRASLLGGLARALSSRKDKQDRKQPAKPDVEAGADAKAAPSVDPDAPLDPQLANEPLEPGSGAPDLNAIMRRVRDERTGGPRGAVAGAEVSRADFIAAARRAAQAAAAEADTIKRSAAARDAAGDGKGRPSGLAALLKTQRKTLLMGVAAVLIALAAFQGGKIFLGGGNNVARAPTPAAVVANVAPQETPAAPVDEPAAPQVRMAGEATPAATPAQIPDVAQTAQEAGDGWLDLETTAAAPARPDEAAAVENQLDLPAATSAGADDLPQPATDVAAEIPLEAGPAALREAAAAGDPKAQFEIGNRYAEGRGVAEDMAKAAAWYEKAAGQGLAPAQYRIGSFYEKGIGVERDIATAKRWYVQAAEAGNASAMHNLAVLHAMGAEGASDNNAAARWFLRAAELGVRDSQFNLGILSAKGVGMPQNLQEAYKWFALVAKAGDKDAADKRDEIARAMRPEQLETARAAAELWRVRDLDPEANGVEIPEGWSESRETTAGVDMRAAVRNIQTILNKNGYQAGTADGLMGQRTKTAIAAFQKDNDMTPTGEVDEALVRALLERR